MFFFDFYVQSKVILHLKTHGYSSDSRKYFILLLPCKMQHLGYHMILLCLLFGFQPERKEGVGIDCRDVVILAIETSCDEPAAVVVNGRKIFQMSYLHR